MKTLICSPSQIQAILAGASEIWIPMKPQPTCSELAGEELPPFASGTRVACKEPWAIYDRRMDSQEIIEAGIPDGPDGLMPGSEGFWKRRVIYRAEGEPDVVNPQTWRSARSMPIWAVRTFFLVGPSDPRDLDTMTESEAEAAGIDDGYLVRNHVPPPRVLSFRRDWEMRYPKVPWSSWAWRISIERVEGK